MGLVNPNLFVMHIISIMYAHDFYMVHGSMALLHTTYVLLQVCIGQGRVEGMSPCIECIQTVGPLSKKGTAKEIVAIILECDYSITYS